MARFGTPARLAAIALVLVSPVLGAPPRTGADEPSYSGPWGSGWEPSDVAIADLDGDGDADLVVSYGFTAKLNVCLGDGAGLFEGLTEIDTDPGVIAVAVGYRGKDRVPFLAALNGKTEELSIYTRDALGAFVRDGADHTTGKDPVAVVVGYEDPERTMPFVAVVNRGSHDLSIFVWSEEGSFAARAADLKRGPQQEPTPIAAAGGDFDGDGREDDLAVLNGKYAVVTLLTGKGGGEFERKHKDFRVTDHPADVSAGVIGEGRTPILAVTDGFRGDLDLYIQNRESAFGFRAFASMRTGGGAGVVAWAEVGTMGVPLVVAADRTRGQAVVYLVEPGGESNLIGEFRIDDNPRAVAVGCLSGAARPFLVVAGRRLYTFPLFDR